MPRLRWRSGLYAITDTTLHQKEILLNACEEVLRGGAVVLQYRDKTNDTKRRLWEATALKKLCTHYQTTFIINDDCELSRLVDADGVHIGKNDTSLLHARETLGIAKIIGVSCYNDIDFARHAMKNSANYVAFGAFFTSQTKPKAPSVDISILKAAQTLGVPVVAIGGINLANVKQLISAGAHNAAVIADIWSAENRFKQSSAYTRLFQGSSLPNFEQGF